MDNAKFIEEAKKLVAIYVNKKVLNRARINAHPEDVCVVWSCKTLQNNKALLSLPEVASGGRYFEVTYNGDKKEFYFDAYKKEHNEAVAFEE